MRRVSIDWRTATVGVLAGALALAACGDNIREPEIEEPELLAIETVAPESVRAGEVIAVTCQFLDAAGAEVFPEEPPAIRLRFAPEDGIVLTGDGDRIATRAGELEISCIAPDLALFDESPALTTVEPGPVTQLVTTLDRDLMIAGETATATCEAFDAFGNRVEDAEPTLVADPELSTNTLDGLAATMTGAGLYELACDLSAVETTTAALEVVPGLPASIVVSPLPDRPVYARGEIIELAHIVHDRYQNPIPDAGVAIASVPAADVADGARFRYFADGFYDLIATVQGPVDPDALALLSASATVLIDGAGPEIACDQPGDAAILDLSPGTDVAFAGSVADLAGVTEVLVNGAPVALDGSGNFATTVPTTFGINFVDLSATDEFGKESSRVCSFMVSDRWAGEDAAEAGAVSMSLRQAAIDDGSRSGGMSSIGDMFHAVINSNGLKQAIHQLLLAANPLKPKSCDLRIIVCVVESRIDYLTSNFAGVNTIDLDLVSGGIRAQLKVNDARLRMRVTGTFDTTGWIIVDDATVSLIFNTTLVGGRPRITIRSGSLSTQVGNIEATGFSGVSGWFLENVIFPFMEGRVRQIIENQVSALIRTRFAVVLDDLMANLDISSLGATFDVERLDDGPPIPMSFNPSFSSVNAANSRLLFGLSTRFSAPPAHARPSLGAPVANPPGPVNPQPTSTPAAIAIHSGVLGQAVHALWRAGLFDATLAGGASFPEGASAVLRTGLPPAVRMLGGDRIELALGDVALTLTYPGVFPDPVEMVLGIRASLRFLQSGDDLAFDDFVIEELYFTSLTTSIDPASRDVIEEFLADVLGNMMGDALNGALPALPIPSFELPTSVGEYGLPAGATLGLASPALSAAIPQLVLSGALSIQ